MKKLFLVFFVLVGALPAFSRPKNTIFNKEHINDPKGAEEELRTIIADYRNSEFTMFTEIAEKLEEHIPEIVYSFTYISGNSNSKNRDDVLRRISNGPIESLNRDPKTLRRLSRGVSNFEYTRNRILWATREDPHILGVPKDRKFIHKVTGKTRGSYKKKNDDDFER